MMLSILNRAAGIFIVTLFIAFSINVNGQEEKVKQKVDNPKFKQTATELTNSLDSLAEKVNLTANQTKEIIKALIDYQKDIADLDPMIKENERNGKISEFDKDAQSEITSILDDNQITAYNGVKEQWWLEVKSKVQPATVRQNQDKDKPY